ncbi:AAA+ ATPase [Gracilaria domingensis]|nr:AAA+ ATPase [Gracilaria domingensis]
MDSQLPVDKDGESSEDLESLPFSFVSPQGSVSLHVGHLPSSFLLIFPKVLPCAMIAVLPEQALSTLNLKHGQQITMNTRLAKVYSAQVLLPGAENDGSEVGVFSIALLSPCLHYALTRDQEFGKTFTVEATERTLLDSVVLSSIVPHPLPSRQASRVAALAKRSLIGQGVRCGDIFPISTNVWLEVQKITGSGAIGKDTSVAITLGSRNVTILNESHKYVRAWALAKWREAVPWDISPFAELLATALDAKAGIILIEGLDRDVEDVIRNVFVGRAIKLVRHSSGKDLKEAIARCELAGGGAVVVQHIDDEMKDIIGVKQAKREEHWGRLISFEEEGEDVSFVVCSEHRDDVDREIMQSVDIDIVIPKASEEERTQILKQVIASISRAQNSCDIEELVRLSTGFARQEVHELGKMCLAQGIEACREAVGYFEKGKLSIDSGGVTWADVGGLDEAKEQILELVGTYDSTAVVQSEKRSVRTTASNRRVGLLLYGPPGTGKTLLARAVASECGCSFIAVKGPELLDMYVGESEKNVRKVFERAMVAAPCVIFFDELDALAPNRGRGSDSGGVSDRVVSQLLSELDLISSRPDIFVIAATNRPDLIDSGLLRPGRLDKMVYVSMPQSREDQAKILKAQTSKFAFAHDVDLDKALSHAPEPPLLSGADIYAIASSAWMSAAKRAVAAKSGAENATGYATSEHEKAITSLQTLPDGKEEYETYRDWFSGHAEENEDSDEQARTKQRRKKHNVIVSQDDLIAAARSLQPSLSVSQLHEYEKLRRTLESGS